MPAGGNVQTDPTAYIPVRLTNGVAFYTAGGGGGGSVVPKGFVQLSSTLSAAVGLTVPAGATAALIAATGSGVMWTDDGVTIPTSTIGMPMWPGQPPQLFAGDLAQLKFIQMDVNTTLNISFYG